MNKFNSLRSAPGITLLALPLLALLLLASASGVRAQCPTSVHASGLKAPVKLLLSEKDKLLVAEAGDGPNTGRISIVERSGLRRTLLDGLPSGFAPPEFKTSGPSGLALRGRTLFIIIGAGDGTLSGPVGGTEIANPNPSSPILSSVLAVQFSARAEETTDGFTLVPSDHEALKNGERLTLHDGEGNRLTVRLVADFPNSVPAPRPGLPDLVRPSNPFGVAVKEEQLYVVDAGMNMVRRVDSETGDTSTLITFAPLSNPLFPFGPPFIDPVPDSIRLYGEQLLVTLLTGFPFPQGLAEVRQVAIADGSNATLISGLSSAIDVLPMKALGGEDQFFTLEFSANQLAQAPGRMRLYAAPGKPPVVIANCLITPTSMALDRKTGEMFVTEIFTGRIVRVQLP